jgi:hypothetical protein
MHHHSLRSTATKVGLIVAVVLLASAAVAYTFQPIRPGYEQILLDISPSDASNSVSSITACARDAVDTALKGSGSLIDIALVSGSPDAMNWKTIDARESIWTRLTIGKAARERQATGARAFADIAALTESKQPPGASNELAALATGQARANAIASGIRPSRRTIVLCGDGHFVGAGGSSYTANLGHAGIGAILDGLRQEGLLPNWHGAKFVMSFNAVDRVDLSATRESAILRFWRAWATASNAS